MWNEFNLSHPNNPGASLTNIQNQTTSTKKNDQKHVLLLGYMRGGSSFLGQMFLSNPDVFYWFEILDPMYGAMMGLKLYSNALEITHNENGSRR